MLRTPLTHLLILALLFISIEGAVDFVGADHPHGDEYGHHMNSDAGISTELYVSNNPTGSQDDSLTNKLANNFDNPLSADTSGSEHCQHCCHGHSSSITVHFSTYFSGHLARPSFSVFQAQLLSLAQAPADSASQRLIQYLISH